MNRLAILLVIILPGAALARLPLEDAVARDHVDWIEVNYFYDEQASVKFVQVLFWDLDLKYGAVIRDWRLIRFNERFPIRHYRTGLWVCCWHDTKKRHGFREVTSWACTVSHTWWDPEMENRKVMNQDRRRELSPIPPR